MKKITLMLSCLIASLASFAQDNCNSALDLMPGVTTTVGTINGTYEDECWITSGTAAEFYKYTATADGVIVITSDLAQNVGLDTRLSIFTGDCSNLICDSQSDDTNNNYLTTHRLRVSNGTTYYIQWDNYWDSSGFDFILTEVSCESSLPFMDDFSNEIRFIACWQNIDDNGDGYSWFTFDYDINDDDQPDGNPCLVSESYRNSLGAALFPDNWLISNNIDLTGLSTSDNINLTWQARGIDPNFANENYTVYVATGDQIADFLASSVNFNEIIGQNDGAGSVFVDRTLDVSSLAGNMIYIAFRHHNVSDQFQLNIDNVAVDVSLGENDFNQNQFSYRYDKNSDHLSLKSTNFVFDDVKIYNLLGQAVYKKQLSGFEETLDLSNINDGIYLVNVKAGNSRKTIKLLKQ